MNKAHIQQKANAMAAKTGIDHQVISGYWGKQSITPIDPEYQRQGAGAPMVLNRSKNNIVSYVAIAALQPARIAIEETQAILQ